MQDDHRDTTPEPTRPLDSMDRPATTRHRLRYLAAKPRLAIAVVLLVGLALATLIVSGHGRHSVAVYERRHRTPKEHAEEIQETKCRNEGEISEGGVPGTPNHGGCESETEYDEKAAAYAHRPPDSQKEAKELKHEEIQANVESHLDTKEAETHHPRKAIPRCTGDPACQRHAEAEAEGSPNLMSAPEHE